MKMDKNTMFMIGAGVLGFVAVRYYLKNRNKKEASSNFIGTGTGSKCRVNIGGVYHDFDCGQTVNIGAGVGSEWNGYTANCSSQGSFGCTVTSPQGMVYNGTKTRATKKMRLYSSACGCGA